MKQLIIFILLVILPILTGCDRCGKDIKLGDFELMPESIADWFPYSNIDEMTFTNSSGKVIKLKNKRRWELMERQYFREICRKGWADFANEYYRGEWLFCEYGGIFDGITYSIEISLKVEHFAPTGFETNLILYDRVSYSSLATRGTSIGVGGSVALVASYRGNTIDDDNLYFLIHNDFAEEILINAVPFKDVWYFDREGTPSLYVQMDRGIIAFAGLDEELWVLQ